MFRFLCITFCICITCLADITPSIPNASEKKTHQPKLTHDINIIIITAVTNRNTQNMTNWTYFIRDSIITESIRLVYDGSAEMRSEAVKYSELDLRVYTTIHICIYTKFCCFFFSCVRNCFFFFFRLLFENRELYKQEVDEKRNDRKKESKSEMKTHTHKKLKIKFCVCVPEMLMIHKR